MINIFKAVVRAVLPLDLPDVLERGGARGMVSEERGGVLPSYKQDFNAART